MDIKQVTEEADDDLFQEEDSSYNMRDLFDQVVANKEIIVTIPEEQLSILKTGLVKRKVRDNEKLKGAGLPPMLETLSFLHYPADEKKYGKGFLDVRIKLAPRKNVTVKDLRIPGDF